MTSDERGAQRQLGGSQAERFAGQPGKMLYEIVGVSEELAREAFRLAAAKLPLRTTSLVNSALDQEKKTCLKRLTCVKKTWLPWQPK